MPKVSVIIPTYKHQDYVRQALESVFAQSFTDYEVIVVNDGSPDDTAEILRPLVEAGRIRYIEQANAGQGAARNRGIAEATGEYIALLDDDDLWPVDKLQTQVAVLQSDDTIGMVGGGVTLLNMNGVMTGQETMTAHQVTFESLFHGCPFVSPGQTLIRASALKGIGGFNERIWGADDFDLWLRLARRTRIVTMQETALLYRVHAHNASNNTRRMFDNSLVAVRQNLRHAPRRLRPQLSRNAYHFLYGYIGEKSVRVVKSSLKSGQFLRCASDIRLVAKFFIPALRDRALLRRVVRDLVPTRLLKRLRQCAV